MTPYEQFLVAYARKDWEKALALYDEYNAEFPNDGVVDEILTIIDIETDLQP